MIEIGRAVSILFLPLACLLVSGGAGLAQTADISGHVAKIHHIARYFSACFQKNGLETGPSGKEITLRMSFRRDGTLIGAPRITYLRKISSPNEQNLFLASLRQTLKTCLPIPITEELGGVIAGRPLAIRFIYAAKQGIDL